VEQIGQVLRDATISISLLATVCLIGSLYVVYPPLLWSVIAVGFCVLTPHFLMVPAAYFNHYIDSSWRRLRSAAVVAQEAAVRRAEAAYAAGTLGLDLALSASPLALSASPAALSASAATLARVESLPRLVMNWRGILGNLVIYLFPVFAFALPYLLPYLVGRQ
jgi:hypothetical protein